MYVLPGKQTTPALRQKTVKRGDIAVGEMKVDNVQACTTCDQYGFEHQRAKQQEQYSPWNLKASGKCDFLISQNRGHVLQGPRSHLA